LPNQRHSARLGDVEDAAVRTVFFLPNVLFVITSRRRLDWADDGPSVSLEFAGGASLDRHRQPAWARHQARW
jgi:hypothetical protein